MKTCSIIIALVELRYVRGIENVVKCTPIKWFEHHPIQYHLLKKFDQPEAVYLGCLV